MVTVNNLATLQSHISSLGTDFLGQQVFWTLDGAEVATDMLAQIWTSAGLDPAHLPKPLTPEKALRLAVREASTGLETTMVVRSHDNDSSLAYGVVLKDRTAETGQKFGMTIARVTLNHSTGVVSVDNPEDETAKKVVAAYEKFLKVHPSMHVMTAIVKQISAMNGVRLRDSGGVYFVLGQYAATLKSMQGAISKLGKSRVFLLDIPATPNNHETAGVAAQQGIEDELARLGDEIKEFLQDTPRPSTLENRLTEFEALRGQAQMYRSALGVALSDVDGAIDAMEQSVRGMLAKVEAEKAAKKLMS